ncbi:MAG: UMP kinase [Magnetococcales bacterium]|nr:UMP kinase [Magnetococcales bacterium]
MGSGSRSLDPVFLSGLAAELKEIHDLGVEMALVVGGGNIFRGLSASGENAPGQSGGGARRRVRGDHMGMLATVINALALENALEEVGVPARVQTGLAMPQVAERFSQRQAVEHLEQGRVVIFGAGTGNPYFSTDTAAGLRALEIGADLLLKGTKVDGVYDSDPVANPTATRYAHLTYAEVLRRGLRVMDLTAISLCQENRLPIHVFSIVERGVLTSIFRGAPLGTIIGG